MKIAIMQPYFFPYAGYFSLMAEAELFVIFDSVQYIDKGWLNRNRLLHPNEQKEWQYFTLPLKNKSNLEPIRNLEIHPKSDIFLTLKGKLSFLKKRAPFFQEAMTLIEATADCVAGVTKLSEFNAKVLSLVGSELSLNCKIIPEELVDYKAEKVSHAGQWALEISSSLNASEYINPIAGSHLFKKEEFDSKGIQLKFLEPQISDYPQYRQNFVSNLSIIDCVMWCGLEETSRKIKAEYQISKGV